MVAKRNFLNLKTISVLSLLSFSLLMYYKHIGLDTGYELFIDFRLYGRKMDLSEDQIFNESFPLHQNDSRLLNYIRSHYLIPPSEEPYNLSNPTGDPSEGQAKIVLQIFNYTSGGFFVECGAWNGETLSNTLVLERDYQWEGFLVEANTNSFANLRLKNRKAWLANVCLSPVKHPKIVEFTEITPTDKKVWWQPGHSSIKSYFNESYPNSVSTVHCFPLFSLLLALGVTTIDFFSLDIEGAEMDILNTIPFDRVLIKVFCLEWNLVSVGKQGMIKFMESKDYKLVKDLTGGATKDLFFAHKSVPIPATFKHVSRKRSLEGQFKIYPKKY